MNKPNILFITTDQQRYDTIHAHGYEFMHTPNLDRLAHEAAATRMPFHPIPSASPPATIFSAVCHARNIPLTTTISMTPIKSLTICQPSRRF